MFVPRQQYIRELQIATMREIDSGKSVGEVARTYQVSPKRLETWRGEWRARGELLALPGHAASSQSKLDAQRIPELERKIGQQAMEIDFLKKVLRRFREQSLPNIANGGAGSTTKSGKQRTRRQQQQ
jgi:transposase